MPLLDRPFAQQGSCRQRDRGYRSYPKAPGANAGVALLIGNNPTSPAKGSATLDDAKAADLMGGRWYVNIHTAANRGGEIRGQVVK